MSLPYSAVSWSALSDCGISCSYSPTCWSFLVYYNQNKLVLLCKLLNCLSVNPNCELSHNHYCYSRSIVEYVRFGKPVPSSLQAGVHFRYGLEHVHLIDMHFVLHKQLIRCMYTTGIASKHFQTTYSQSVPSCHKSLVSVGLFSRSIVTWSARSYILA